MVVVTFDEHLFCEHSVIIAINCADGLVNIPFSVYVRT